MDLEARQDVGEFPAQGSDEEKLAFAARFAILAPSTHNSQPWRFLMRERLRDPLGQTGHPQLVLRLGYGSAVPPTARRPVGDVVRVTR